MPSNLWRVKGPLYRTLGVLFPLLLVVGVLAAFSYCYGWLSCEPSNLPVITAACIPTGLVPGIVLILLGRSATLREKELIAFTA